MKKDMPPPPDAIRIKVSDVLDRARERMAELRHAKANIHDMAVDFFAFVEENAQEIIDGEPAERAELLSVLFDAVKATMTTKGETRICEICRKWNAK